MNPHFHLWAGKSQEELFGVERFNTICDTATQSVYNRFDNNEKLLKNCVCLDPKHFSAIIASGLSSSALEELSSLIQVDASLLLLQLSQFDNSFPAFKTTKH